MSHLTEQIRQALHGLAIANLGERSGRRAMHAALSSKTLSAKPVPNPVSPPAAGKWIALGVGRSLPPHVMAYVSGACRRMGAGLLLITRDGMATRALLAPYLPDLAGIACLGEELDGQNSVASCLDRHRGVLFAVTGCEDDPLHPLLHPRRGTRSPVPLVLVSQKPAGPA